jgi:hypothetical protein
MFAASAAPERPRTVMLTNFFRLNGTTQDITTNEDFLKHFKTTTEMRNVVLNFDPLELPEPQNRLKQLRFINVSFSKKTIQGLSFTECEFEDCLFISSIWVNCKFDSCRFRGCNTYRMQINNTYIDPRSFVNMLDPKRYTNIGIDLFEKLLKNYRDNGHIDFIPTAEFEYRKWKRFRLMYPRPDAGWNTLSFRKKIERSCSLISQLFFEYTAGYGWKISRFFGTSVFAFLCIFSINLIFWEQMSLKANDAILQNKDPLTILYFSIMLMSTLGFNSINPQSGLGMALVSLEALAGPVWISILAALIIKKAIR